VVALVCETGARESLDMRCENRQTKIMQRWREFQVHLNRENHTVELT
jgi:hypothetical protein